MGSHFEQKAILISNKRAASESYLPVLKEKSIVANWCI
ncbi:hypothetical protein B4117_5851 [Bacillus mycoides]|nr:hypothetical protein B4117_5851 [Bacillus mycoides]